MVQSALSTSRNSAESHISQIFDCTFAITFFGTPHLGSDLALWGSFVSSIANIVKPANKDIVSILKPGSEMLEQIHQDFNSILRLRRDIAITCFYEELTYGSMRRVWSLSSSVAFIFTNLHKDDCGTSISDYSRL